MAILDRLAAGLAWLGRHGTEAVAVSMFVGIAVPPLGALMRPYFPETVIVLLVLAFLRVEPAGLRSQLSRPGLLAMAATWTMLAVPALIGVALAAGRVIDVSPALLLALMLHTVAPPTFSSPALAALIGLNAALSLALLIVCIVATPFTAPALVAVFAGPAVTLSPVALGIRLALILAGAAAAAWAIRAIAGRAWVERQAERIDGLSVIALFGFAVALMGNVLANTLANPLLVLGLIALATALSLGLSALTALLFLRASRDGAFALAHAAGSRNMGLMLAASAGLVPELVWLYVALAQFPIYLLPLAYKPLTRRLGLGKGAAGR
jgi:BASS family bile acid:Na+ symporter